jgi:hypothetical protein
MRFGPGVGVKDKSNTSANALTVFPDPSRGAFTVNIAAGAKEVVNNIITNTLGQKVKEWNAMTNTDTEVQLIAPAGLYFITAEAACGRYSGKLLITK